MGPRPADRALVVLVVEDDSQVRDLLCHIFRDEGMETVEARNAEEALRRLAVLGDDVSVIVLDLMLPGRSGLAILPELTAWPVLVLTALNDRKVLKEAARLGATVMVKPFAPVELVQTVRQLAVRRSSESSE